MPGKRNEPLYSRKLQTNHGTLYTVLLSGGSGKRLWPLSNNLRSKQYIKLLTYENSDQTCSMVQRVMGQLNAAGLSDHTVICASAGQVEMLRSQLDNVHIAIEPDRRDTFPAVMLACAYLASEMKANADDVVCVLPVDPYTESGYFETLQKLRTVIQKNRQTQIALMGVTPTHASTEYGYIVPNDEHFDGLDFDCYGVARFQEKPDEATAEALLAQHALWNCGVFCFRIGDMLGRCPKYGLQPTYNALVEHYDQLPKISFDYEVLEKTSNLAVVPFTGLWKDLGTWNTLTEEMHSRTMGFVLTDAKCENSNVINELNIPVVAVGTKKPRRGCLVRRHPHCGQRGLRRDQARDPGCEPSADVRGTPVGHAQNDRCIHGGQQGDHHA